ncbi:O-antigen ligase family protein [Microbacterium sp. A588]
MPTIRVAKHINAIPILTLIASVSVGLGNGIYWLIGLAAALAIATVRAPRNLVRAFLRTLPATLIIAFFAIYSVVVTRDIEVTASVLNVVCWAPLIILIVAQYQRFGTDYFTRGLKQLNYVLVATACWGIIEGIVKYNVLVHVYPHILGSWRMGTPEYRASAIFSHPIPFAHMLVIGLIITLTLQRGLLLKIVMSSLFLGAIVTTQTRSAWAIIAALLAVFIVQSFWLGRGRALLRGILKAWPFVAGGIAVLVAFIWLTPFGFGVLERLQRIGPEDVSLTQRTASIEAVLNAVFNESSVTELLFGHGFSSSNAFILSDTLVLEGISTTDNQWLALLYDFGLIGLLLFLAVTVYVIMAWWKLSRRPGRAQSPLALCTGYIAVCAFMFMAFYAFTIWRGIQVVVILAFCVLVLLQREKPDPRVYTAAVLPPDAKSSV